MILPCCDYLVVYYVRVTLPCCFCDFTLLWLPCCFCDFTLLGLWGSTAVSSYRCCQWPALPPHSWIVYTVYSRVEWFLKIFGHMCQFFLEHQFPNLSLKCCLLTWRKAWLGLRKLWLLPSYQPNLPIFWNGSNKNIPDQQKCVQFWKSQNSAKSLHPSVQHQ